MKILITGCNGFIGRNLVRLLSDKYSVDAISRHELDLADSDAVQKFFVGKKYHLVIHTAVKGGRRTLIDDVSIVHDNVSMIYNLLANQDHFDKIITFGSGAELDRRFDINGETDTNRRYPVDFYGMSKSIIHKLCLVEPKLYNFRIFNCFGIDEASDRMIRGNVERYIRKEPMTLFSNRLMDFFYIEDLATLIQYFAMTPTYPHKVLNCSYLHHYRLKDILEIINGLGGYSVPILDSTNDSIGGNGQSTGGVNTDYIGLSQDFEGTLEFYKYHGLKFVGLENGIKLIYTKLLESYEIDPSKNSDC